MTILCRCMDEDVWTKFIWDSVFEPRRSIELMESEKLIGTQMSVKTRGDQISSRICDFLVDWRTEVVRRIEKLMRMG